MPTPIITLLSDFGTSDTTVTVAKATLLSNVPEAKIIDISHRVAKYDLRQTSYLLQSVYGHYPAGSIHIAMVDVFAGEQPRMLLAAKESNWFIVPDNGILPLTFRDEITDQWLCHEFTQPFTFRDWITNAGRVIQAIQSGAPLPFDATEAHGTPAIHQPVSMGGLECNILFIDRYGNVVLDINQTKFEEAIAGRQFRIKIMRMEDITALSNNYNDVPLNKPLCRFNAAGYLEIAINHGQAATSLGISPGNSTNIRYRTIRIFIDSVQSTT